MDLETLAPEVLPHLRLLPVIHDRVDMASLVRGVLEEVRPSGIAVELPTTLGEHVWRAVGRLPKVSLVISEEPGEEALVWVSAPGEPFAEALRWASVEGRPAFFIDPDVLVKERRHDRVPDPYAMWSLGPERYLQLLADQAEAAPRSDQERAREAGMAHHVKEARREAPEGCLLVLVGAAHISAVMHHLRQPTAQPFARVRRTRVELRHLHPESLTGLLPDPPLAHSVFEILREGRAPEDADLELTLSRRISLIRHGLRVVTGDKEEAERPMHVARYAAQFGNRRGLGNRPVPDRVALQRVVWRVGAGSYERQTEETTKLWQRKLFFDYCRRYARIQGLLVPGLYEWVVAARGVGDDNLAWEVFDVARTFPWQETKAEIATVKVDGNELDLGTRKITFRKRFFRVKQRLVRLPVRERPATDDPEKWIEAFNMAGLCSHRPEDVVIEDYARFLQQKAVSILSAERKRTEPFTASLLDGIDMRETLRNLHEDRIYVQELGRAPGLAGSVVVIFDRDLRGMRFPYCMTWLGEHEQESDMAFYSTNPGEQVVGPGIMRATYGGFMMTYPPRRVVDVWQDRDYRWAKEKAEVLLMSGVDYSQEKIIVHVAKGPPSRRMASYAAYQSKKLVHIPIGSLSPVTLKKIRVVHLLAGYDKRPIANNYIW